jgi:hypothetical protein
LLKSGSYRIEKLLVEGCVRTEPAHYVAMCANVGEKAAFYGTYRTGLPRFAVR